MGLYENMLSEPVDKLALREVLVISPDTSLRQAVELMREKRLGCVMICDDDRKPLGMFTEGMLKQLIVADPGVIESKVSEHMAERFCWVKHTDPIVMVLDAMQAKNVRFVCVVDDEGRVSALTGQKGLMEYVADHFPGEVMVQRIGGTPYTHEREGA